MVKNNAERRERKKLKLVKKGKFKRQKSKKRWQLTVISLIAILFIISIAEFIYFYYNVYLKVYDVFLSVDNKIGINIDVENSTLNLGIVPPGGSVKREIVIVNTGETPLVGNVISKGNLAELLSIERSFIIQKDETKSLPVVANVPHDAKIGNYTGKIILIFRKA